MGFDLLRSIRKERALTQTDLALLIGVKPSVISRYETGSLTPTAKRLEELAQVLNVDFQVLLSGLKEPLLVEYGSKSQSDHNAIELIKLKQKYHATLEKAKLEKISLLERLTCLAANGKCELCGQPAPFKDKTGMPFLEICTADSTYIGPPTVKNLIALCPNCHARILFLQDSNDLKRIKEIASLHNF